MTRASTMSVFSGPAGVLPAGYAAVPVNPGETGVVRLCVVVRPESRDGSWFVVLRQTLDAVVYLGCVADAAGRVQRWMEIWVQEPGGLAGALPAYREALNNARLDERWAARVEAVEGMQAVDAGAGGGSRPAMLLRTGWETAHPEPMFIDVVKKRPVPAKDRRTGGAWALCTDEGLLSKKGVSGYGASLARHVWQPAFGEDSPVVPVDLADAGQLGLEDGCVPLNAGGGLMMVQAYAPMSYEQYIDAITGVPTLGMGSGMGGGGAGGESDPLKRSLLAASGMSSVSGAGGASGPGGLSSGWLRLRGVGTSGKLVEALHLKLMALSGAASAVRSATAATQAPMLNLSAASLRVRLAEGTGAIPLWWTAQPVLVEPGEGAALDIPGTSTKYYVGPRAGSVSIYAPAMLGRAASGKGVLRLRDVQEVQGGVVVEGTLLTQERLYPGSNDLVWMRMVLGGTRLDVYGSVDTKAALGSGEMRVRSVPQTWGADVVARLRSALGVPMPETSYEVVPLISTPADLYALGVLAVRTLLVDGRRPLPVALDEVLSLAARAASKAGEGSDLVSRIGESFAEEPRLAEALGPQRLVHEVVEPGKAFEAIPPRLWHGTLAMIVRMLTGVGPDASCKDFGDAPSGAVQRVFDRGIDDLYALVSACRGLIVSDQALNAEVRSVVAGVLASARR